MAREGRCAAIEHRDVRGCTACTPIPIRSKVLVKEPLGSEAREGKGLHKALFITKGVSGLFALVYAVKEIALVAYMAMRGGAIEG